MESQNKFALDEASACAGCGQECLCLWNSAVRAVLAKAAVAAERCGGTLTLRGGVSRPQGSSAVRAVLVIDGLKVLRAVRCL